jgi:hypothetical protein
MAKKKVAKKKVAPPKEKGEQQELFELLGEHAAEIKQAGKLYKKYQKTRLESLKLEIAQKTVIRELAKKANLQRMSDGVIRFKVDGMEIEIEPRDDVVRVKEKKEPKATK